MKTLRCLSTTGILALGLVLASKAADDKGAQRRDQMAKTQADLKAFCAEVKGWKQADDKTGVTPLSQACGNISKDAQAQLTVDVDSLIKNCGELENTTSGVPPLAASGAPLEKVTKDHWEDLTDKLGEVVLDYRGTNAFRGSVNQSYDNCYGRDCSKPADKCSAIVQLVSDARAQFTTNWANTLSDAVGDLSPKEVPPAH
jgi:hypothetical protein